MSNTLLSFCLILSLRKGTLQCTVRVLQCTVRVLQFTWKLLSTLSQSASGFNIGMLPSSSGGHRYVEVKRRYFKSAKVTFEALILKR
jgi:hypothetical protein